MRASDEPEQRRAARYDSLVHRAIGPVFILLAIWFLFGPDLERLPEHEGVQVGRHEVTTDPLRATPPNDPTILAGGYAMGCMECHRLFISRPDSGPTLVQHRHIVLDHGLNDRCLNCHDAVRRDRLRLASGETVPFTAVARNCAGCHGTAYRDWQEGMHGRTSGSWDVASGNQRRLTCTECHDPHAPAVPPMRPLPGPHTLRMPVAAHEVDTVNHRDPLRVRGSARPGDRPDESTDHSAREHHE